MWPSYTAGPRGAAVVVVLSPSRSRATRAIGKCRGTTPMSPRTPRSSPTLTLTRTILVPTSCRLFQERVCASTSSKRTSTLRGRPFRRQASFPRPRISWERALAACRNAAKDLCGREVWVLACSGPKGQVYPYGNAYDPDACNGRDRGSGVAITGASPMCVGAARGVYDLGGNVSEWVDFCEGGMCYAFGGNDFSPADGMTCTSFFPVPPDLEFMDGTGFRCCRPME